MKAKIVLSCALLALAAAGAARAQLNIPPPELEGIGITEHLDATLPLDAVFLDESGREVRLAEYFRGERPVVLSIVYYSCPMLCTLVLNGLVEGLEALEWSPGEEFEIVTVSFDSTETPLLATQKKQNYLRLYGRTEAEAGWHFLTGSGENIRKLTEIVGFGYRWDDETDQFAHQAAIYLVTPDGRLSRYLYGVKYAPRDLKLGLLEASEGKIGSTLDQIVMYCYHYDAAAGSYALAATRFTRAIGALTLLVFGGWLVSMWIRDARRRRPSPGAGEA